jgi:hypothetical protein
MKTTCVKRKIPEDDGERRLETPSMNIIDLAYLEEKDRSKNPNP